MMSMLYTENIEGMMYTQKESYSPMTRSSRYMGTIPPEKNIVKIKIQ